MTTGEVSSLIGSQQVKELPLNGRSFVQLTQLMPGVSPDSTFDSKNKGLMAGVDFSVNGNNTTGNLFLVDGVNTVIGGTSAVAPLYAGLVALINEKISNRCGFLNPVLYGAAAKQAALHDITKGTNGAYKAAKGWDACTGLGSPDGRKILTALST